MTSHHDVADSVAWLRQPRWIEGSFQKKLFDIADILESQAKALSEAEAERDRARMKLLAATFDGNTFEARALAAEARLAEAVRVIERDMEALTEADTQIEYLHDKFKPTGSGASAIARIDIALTAARTFTNAAKTQESKDA